MEIKTDGLEHGKKQLFIDGLCVSGPHDQEIDCYREFIEAIINQKGMLTFNEKLPF